MKKNMKIGKYQNEVKQIIGEELPEMGSPKFQATFEKLNKNNPFLAQQVLEELRADAHAQVQITQENRVKKEKKRREFVDKMVRSRGREPGDKSLNNQKVLGIIVGLSVVTFLGLTVLGNLKPARADAEPETSAVTAVSPTEMPTVIEEAAPASVLPTSVNPPPAPPPLPSGQVADVSQVRFGTVGETRTPPAPAASAAPPPLPEQEADSKLVADQLSHASALVVEQPTEAAPTLVAEDEVTESPQAGAGGLVMESLASENVATQPTETAASVQPSGVSAEPTEGTPWDLASASEQYGFQTVEVSPAISEESSATFEVQSSGNLLAQAGSEDGSLPSASASDGTPLQATSFDPASVVNTVVPPLTVISARLVTGITAVDATETPVVAEALNDYCNLPLACPPITFYGVATIQAANYVSLRFTYMLVNDQLLPFRGKGLDLSSNPLLAGRIIDEAPAVAQDLVRAALGGIGDYVDAAARQTRTVVLDDGRTVTQGQVPSLESFIFGSAASIFDTPNQATAVIRIIQIDAGQPIKILSENFDAE